MWSKFLPILYGGKSGVELGVSGIERRIILPEVPGESLDEESQVRPPRDEEGDQA